MSLIWSCVICLVDGSSSCSSGLSGVSRLKNSGTSHIGRGSGCRGGPFLFCGRGKEGTRCLGGCDMVNQSVRDPNWRICVLCIFSSAAATAAKPLQLCPTLCNARVQPRWVHGNLQGRRSRRPSCRGQHKQESHLHRERTERPR